MRRNKNSDNEKQVIRSGIYVLKHKDLDVAMVQIDRRSGKIEYVLDVYLPEELPLGVGDAGNQIAEWWALRAVPDSRKGIHQVLHFLGEETSLSLMLSAYGLSLTDHYWMQPIGEELYWNELNFFDNDFSDELGKIMTESGKIDMESHISKFSPASSVNGEMKKKWVIMEDTRYLMKVNFNDYGQQSVNEMIACRMHERLGWDNYVSYRLEKILAEGREYPCSLNPLFTSQKREFVSAYQLVKDYKVPNTDSEFEAVISRAVQFGMEEPVVRRQLEYTIMTDFLLSNTDRHFNNLGFLYDPMEHRLVAAAPIFDTGNALFYNLEVIPSGRRLLDIQVNSFCRREADMLRYVKQAELVRLECLEGFPEEAEQMLREYTDMPDIRASQIARTIRGKMEYLELFQHGKKIWKKETYW